MVVKHIRITTHEITGSLRFYLLQRLAHPRDRLLQDTQSLFFAYTLFRSSITRDSRDTGSAVDAVQIVGSRFVRARHGQPWVRLGTFLIFDGCQIDRHRLATLYHHIDRSAVCIDTYDAELPRQLRIEDKVIVLIHVERQQLLLEEVEVTTVLYPTPSHLLPSGDVTFY